MIGKATVLSLLVLAACGQGIGGGASVPTPAPPTGEVEAQRQDLATEAEQLFRERGDRAKLEQAIARWEQAVTLDPSDWHSRAWLARAYQFLGDAYYDGAAVSERARVFQAGIAHARAGIEALSPRVRELLANGVDISDAIDALDHSAAPLVYWYAADLGSYADAAGRIEGLQQKDRILALIDWVHERAPDFHFYGADRFLGSYYAVVPAMFGGDLARSEQHFRSAIKGDPRYPGNYYLMARFWAPAAGDEALWHDYLGRVASLEPCAEGGPLPCVVPGWEPEAMLDRRRAGKRVSRGFD
ncbi:MAG TPA: TRAP transporter TatT component family protein [Kofleriaceae bacterium]|nr:TRAP transporter TatT component family protein [Kofleriaceae bacterium]